MMGMPPASGPDLPGTGPRPLIDAAERRQAAEDTAATLAVEAAAGTGKTTLLITRMLNLIDRGEARLSEILAITFTELAAAELKSRLRDELQKAGGNSRRREALLELEGAPISTIHAMALSILKERPVEAGLDPAFTTLDPGQAAELFEELFHTWLGLEAGDGVRPGRGVEHLRAAFACGLTVDHLAEAAQRLFAHRDVALADGDAAGRSAASLLQALADPPGLDEDVKSLKRLLREGLQDPGDRLALAAGPVLEFLSDNPPPGPAGAAPALETVIARFHWVRRLERAIGREMPLKTGQLGAQRGWRRKEDLEAARTALLALTTKLAAVKRWTGHAIAADLVGWLRGFVAWAQEEKKQRGVADFLDQLLWCRDLLRDHPAVRRHFQERYTRLLVDEFQDTDPLQAEILFYLAEGRPQAHDWKDVVPGPGRIFMVGDPKQSIYRFRRADVEMYHLATERVASHGQRLTIRQNFRTVPAITRWVNGVFEALMAPDPGAPAIQPPYVPLHPHRPDPGPDELESPGDGRGLLPPGAYRLASPDSPADLKADEWRQAEADAIARALVEYVRGGRMRVFDRALQAWRPARLGDAVILMPAFTGVDRLEQALERADVPYRVVGGRLFYVRAEIRELMLLLGAIHNPKDRQAVLGALRSGFFGVPDAELYRLAAAGVPLCASVEPSGEARQAAPQACRAFDRIRDWHDRIPSLGPSRGLRQVLDESGYRAFLALQPNGSQALANLDKLLAQAAALEAGGAFTFGEFVRWLRRRGPDGSAEAGEEDSPLIGEDDVVRVMTVHKAKGLEFPVVFVANLGSDRGDPGAVAVDRERGRVELRMGPSKLGVETEGFAGAVEMEKRRLAAEQVRLYYVALTRAREYLIVSTLPPDKGFWRQLAAAEESGAGAGTGCPELAPGGAAHEEGGGQEALPGTRAHRQQAAAAGESASGVPDDGLPDPGDWQRLRADVLERARRGLRVVAARHSVVTGARPHGDEDDETAPSTVEEEQDAAGQGMEPVPARRPAAGVSAQYDGTEVGRAFHLVMERAGALGFEAEGDWIEAQARAAALEAGLPEDGGEVREISGWAKAACSPASPLREKVAGCERLLVEVPFAFEQAGVLYEGRIDLLLLHPGRRAVIVDYKTDDASPGEMVRRYAGQAAAYEEGVRRAWAGAVDAVEVYLYAARHRQLAPAGRHDGG